jgi:hypothetical protein
VDKSGICPSTGTIASQWLTGVINGVKAQVAHRCIEIHGEIMALLLLFTEQKNYSSSELTS